MWQCPNCNEQLEPQFESCWKCGTRPDGEREPEFVISEPVRAEDQAEVQTAVPTRLELPAVSYFAIPVYVLVLLAGSIWHSAFRTDTFDGVGSISAFEIVVLVAFAGILGIPIALLWMKSLFQSVRNGSSRSYFAEVAWLLSVFRLPDSIRRKHRWFVPVYVGALYGFCTIVPVLTVADIILQVSR